MDSFEGTWKDASGTTITVKQEGQIVTLTYPNGRGPFQGQLLPAYPPVIQVIFSDTGEKALGKLGVNQIAWSNTTTWTRVDGAA